MAENPSSVPEPISSRMPERISGGAPTFAETIQQIDQIESSAGIPIAQRRQITTVQFDSLLGSRIDSATYQRLETQRHDRDVYIQLVKNAGILDDLDARFDRIYEQLMSVSKDRVELSELLRKIRTDEIPRIEATYQEDIEDLVDPAALGVVGYYVGTIITQMERYFRSGRSSVVLPVGYENWAPDTGSNTVIGDIQRRVEEEIRRKQEDASARYIKERGNGWIKDTMGNVEFTLEPTGNKAVDRKNAQDAVEDIILSVEIDNETELNWQKIQGEAERIREGIKNLERKGIVSRKEMNELKYFTEARLYIFAAEKLISDEDAPQSPLEQYLGAMARFAQEFEHHMNALWSSGDGKIALAAETIERPNTIDGSYGEINFHGRVIKLQHFFRPELDIDPVNLNVPASQRDEFEKISQDRIIKWLLIKSLAPSTRQDVEDMQKQGGSFNNFAKYLGDLKGLFTGDADLLQWAADKGVDLNNPDAWSLDDLRNAEDDRTIDSKLGKRLREAVTKAEDAFKVGKRLLVVTGKVSREGGALIQVNGQWKLFWDEARDRFKQRAVQERLPTIFYPGIAHPTTRENPSISPLFGSGTSEIQAWTYAEASRRLYDVIVWELRREHWDADKHQWKNTYKRPRGFKWLKGIYDLPGNVDIEEVRNPIDTTFELQPNGTPSSGIKIDPTTKDKTEIVLTELIPDVDLFVRYLYDWLDANTLRDIVAGMNDISPQDLARNGPLVRKKEIIEYFSSMLSGAAAQRARFVGGKVGEQSVTGFLIVPFNDPVDVLMGIGATVRNQSVEDLEVNDANYELQKKKFRQAFGEILKPLIQIRDSYSYLDGPRGSVGATDFSKTQIIKAFKRLLKTADDNWMLDYAKNKDIKGGGNAVQVLHLPVHVLATFLLKDRSKNRDRAVKGLEKADEYDEIMSFT